MKLMPRVSKNRQLEEQKRNQFLNDLYAAITSLEDKDEVWAFFEDLLTEEEKLMLAKRFQIAMMLFLKYDWQEVGEYTKVSDFAIASTARKLETKREGLKKVAERILRFKREKLDQLSKGREKGMVGEEILLKSTLGLLSRKIKKGRKKDSIVK